MTIPEPTSTDLDDLAGWVDILRTAKAQIAEKEAVAEQARKKIEERLGDTEVGTIGGVPVVRWTHVASNKFDQKKAKALLTADQVAACTVVNDSRRFTLVEGEVTP